MNNNELYDWEIFGGYDGLVKEIRRLSPYIIFSVNFLKRLAPTRLVWLYYDLYNRIHNPDNRMLIL